MQSTAASDAFPVESATNNQLDVNIKGLSTQNAADWVKSGNVECIYCFLCQEDVHLFY